MALSPEDKLNPFEEVETTELDEDVDERKQFLSGVESELRVVDESVLGRVACPLSAEDEDELWRDRSLRDEELLPSDDSEESRGNERVLLESVEGCRMRFFCEGENTEDGCIVLVATLFLLSLLGLSGEDTLYFEVPSLKQDMKKYTILK